MHKLYPVICDPADSRWDQKKHWLVDFELHKRDFYRNIFISKGIKTNIKFDENNNSVVLAKKNFLKGLHQIPSIVILNEKGYNKKEIL